MGQVGLSLLSSAAMISSAAWHHEVIRLLVGQQLRAGISWNTTSVHLCRILEGKRLLPHRQGSVYLKVNYSTAAEDCCMQSNVRLYGTAREW